MSHYKPIIVRGENWKIPPVPDTLEGSVCMETSQYTTERIYISCGAPATMRLWDDRAGRAYDFCDACGEHNKRRGFMTAPVEVKP